MIIKKHRAQDGRIILAVCDSEILGKTIEEDNKMLDLSSEFYQGEKVNQEQAEKEIKKAYIINLVGEKSVDLGIRLGVLDKENVIIVSGVPHGQGVNENLL